MGQNATTTAVQPGLMPVLRVFAWLQIGIGVVYVLLIVPMAARFNLAVFIPLVSAVIFLVALNLDQLERRLRQAYLPLLLLYATVHVIVLFGLRWQLAVTLPLLTLEAAGELPIIFTGEATQLYTGDVRISFALLIVLSNLFFILLLVSWQYDMRGVFVFCLAATGLDLFVNVALILDQTLLIFPNAGIVLFRNVIFIQIATVIRRLLYVQQEQRAALVEANTQLTRYAIAVEELAISRERNRLARELHDTLAHTLSAATVQLEAAQARWTSDGEKARTAVDKALVITREGLVETRRALKDLRASPLETVGFERALHDLILLMQPRSRAVITLHLLAELPPLSPDGEQTVYRAVQETLENAVRHARADQITVTLDRTPTTLRLRVVDDGVGFDPAQTDINRFGLHGLRERARAVGGEMRVISAPTHGTTVQMEIPLP